MAPASTSASGAAREEGLPIAAPVVEITTTRARAGAIDRRITASGSLLALRESPIGAEVRGRIERVFVRAGDRVEAGAPLFQIDTEPYEVALRQAEAGRDLARAERRQIQADLARLGALHEKAIVSADEVERTKTAVAVARARERQANEVVALANHNLAQTLVRAPFGGSIAERLADEGATALVQPQTIVVVLHETAELEARANIPESELARVQPGDAALVHVEGLVEPIETRVASVGDTIDPETRTYRVTMRIPNPEHRLKGGTFARIEIQTQRRREAILVPRESIRSEGGRSRVLVVEDGRVIAVPVELGVMSDSDAEVLGGIALGTEVVVGDAARSIAPGMRVRVIGGPAAS
jgi:RND family efflux transporter MFP subunit